MMSWKKWIILWIVIAIVLSMVRSEVQLGAFETVIIAGIIMILFYLIEKGLKKLDSSNSGKNETMKRKVVNYKELAQSNNVNTYVNPLKEDGHENNLAEISQNKIPLINFCDDTLKDLLMNDIQKQCYDFGLDDFSIKFKRLY